MYVRNLCVWVHVHVYVCVFVCEHGWTCTCWKHFCVEVTVCWVVWWVYFVLFAQERGTHYLTSAHICLTNVLCHLGCALYSLSEKIILTEQERAETHWPNSALWLREYYACHCGCQPKTWGLLPQLTFQFLKLECVCSNVAEQTEKGQAQLQYEGFLWSLKARGFPSVTVVFPWKDFLQTWAMCRSCGQEHLLRLCSNKVCVNPDDHVSQHDLLG